jgi:hypothetical protein
MKLTPVRGEEVAVVHCGDGRDEDIGLSDKSNGPDLSQRRVDLQAVVDLIGGVIDFVTTVLNSFTVREGLTIVQYCVTSFMNDPE